MNSVGELKDIFTMARHVGIAGEKIDSFLRTAEMAGYVLVRKDAAKPGGPAGSELAQALAVARKVIADPILWASDYQLLARALLATAQPEAGNRSG